MGFNLEIQICFEILQVARRHLVTENFHNVIFKIFRSISKTHSWRESVVERADLLLRSQRCVAGIVFDVNPCFAPLEKWRSITDG